MSCDIKWLPVGEHGSISDLSSVETLTVPTGANGVFVQVFTENVRYTIDGETDPTASVGFVLLAGNEPYFLNLQNLSELRFIEETASATMQYQFLA